MLQSEKIDQIIPALKLAQEAMGTAKKNSKNQVFGSRYVTLQEVQDVIEGPLKANGLVVVQGGGLSEYGNFIFTTVYHISGQWLRSEFPMILAKQDSQGVGSATTYLRRYGLCAMFNIEQQDDDGNAAALDPKQNGQKEESNSTQKAGKLRANSLREYMDANLLDEKTANEVLKKYKAAQFEDLPKDVADKMIAFCKSKEA